MCLSRVFVSNESDSVTESKVTKRCEEQQVLQCRAEGVRAYLPRSSPAPAPHGTLTHLGEFGEGCGFALSFSRVLGKFAPVA